VAFYTEDIMTLDMNYTNEKRLSILRDFGVLDSGTEKIYDDIAKLTADLCEVPVCVITLVEEDRQWFKSEIGLGICETKIEQSICIHAIDQNSYLEIYDTQLDDRTVTNILCQGEKPFRFYAGALLKTVAGWPLGTLCVLDYKPRRLTELQQRVLKVHASSITRQLEFTRTLLQNLPSMWENNEIGSVSEHEEEFKEKIHELFQKLTPREVEVMKLIVGRSGNFSSKQIAEELSISHRTVDHHRANLLFKMDVSSVAELVAVSLKTRLF